MRTHHSAEGPSFSIEVKASELLVKDFVVVKPPFARSLR